MPTFSRRRPALAVSAVLGVGVGSASLFGLAASYAQTPPAAAPPTTTAPSITAPDTNAAAPAPVAPATAVVDPQAKATLDGIFAAHKALTSYSANIKLSMQQGPTPARTAEGDIAYQKSGKAHVRLTTNGPKAMTQTTVTDGKNIFATASSKPTEYDKRPAAPNGSSVPQAIVEGGATITRLLPGMLGGLDTSRLLGSGTSLSRDPDDTVDGVPVDVLRLALQAPTGPGPVILMTAGKSDHLVRRILITVAAPTGQTTLSEEYSAVKVNPTLPASLFVFTPPAGAKRAAAAPEAAPEEAPMYDARLKAGAKPIAFAGKDLAGQPVNLAQYKGNVVLIDFWATWCPPCREEVPNIVAAYGKYHAKGFDVVGVSLDQAGDRGRLVSYTKANKMPWRQIYDGKYWNSALAEQYKVRSIPFSLLIGKDGRIAAVNPRGPELEPALKAALSK